jgi:hypothetical protein
MTMKSVLIVVLLAGQAAAANVVPGKVPFTARLSDASGPVNGNVSISFAIYDVATGGTAAWTESYPVATALNGLVFVDLGSQTTLDSAVFDGGTKYLEVTVNGTAMSPRLPIGSTPYAIRAATADTVGSLAEADLQRRVGGTCSSGAISTINPDGSVQCIPVGQTYTGTGGVSVAGTTVSLSSTGCAMGYVWKFDGASWSCQPDANTIYTGAGGVSVLGSTVSLDTTGCSAGYVWKYNGTTFACAPDANTTYTFNSPLFAMGTSVSLQTVPIGSGGTGATNAQTALNNLLPSQLANAHDVLVTTGTSAAWADVRQVLAFGDDAGFVVKGSGGVAAPPASGPGRRMMWYQQKAAFRAGSVNGTEWDDASIGLGSIALGNTCTASGMNAVALGVSTTASGNQSIAFGSFTTASGLSSTAFGDGSVASGDYSTAIGHYAITNGHQGSFVYGDVAAGQIYSNADNEFVVRASGGFRFFTNSTLTAGVTLGAGAGSWSSVSDRNAKQDFRPMDGDEVLSKIAAMKIESWRYKAEVSRARHVGPVAQDFRAAFGLGDSDKSITTVDIDGINMLAIQTLQRHVSELERQNRELSERLSRLERAR